MTSVRNNDRWVESNVLVRNSTIAPLFVHDFPHYKALFVGYGHKKIWHYSYLYIIKW